MPGILRNVLPVLLIAVSVAAFFGAVRVLTGAHYYPSMVIRAPGQIEISFLFGPRNEKAICETLTANVTNSILSVCQGCKVKDRQCLEALDPRQQAILSTTPLEAPSVRLPDGGVITYRAPDSAVALAACQESARQTAAGTPNGRVTCYPPKTSRPVHFLQGEILATHKNALGWFLLFVGALAFGSALYLLHLRDDLRAGLRSLPRRTKRIIMIGVDLGLLAAAFIATAGLRYGADWSNLAGLAPVLALALLIAVPVFLWFGMYRDVVRYMHFRAALTIVTSVSLAALALVVLISLLQVKGFRLEDVLIYWLLALLLIGGSRIAAREYLRKPPASPTEADRVVIYGAGDAGAQLAASLRDNKSLHPVAFVDDNPDLAGSGLFGIRVFPSAQLPALVHDLNVRQVLLAMPSASKNRKKELFDRLEPLRVKIRTIPRLSELIAGRASISDIADVGIEDLIGRDPVAPVPELLSRCITGKVVLVTGAGGSIGSELCRQILLLAPRSLILVERSEYSLYAISEELEKLRAKHAISTHVIPVLASVTPRGLMQNLFSRHQVNTIFHTAAYKHVPLLEANALEGIRNNVIGSHRVAEAALAANVETFVLVSTDKAVRPTNVMGASKRLAELIMQAIANTGCKPRFCMVRFGNVLDSSGSVVPVFRKQIQDGGPVTVTHPGITRYFMTIPEAAQLVIQAAAMAKGGDVFVLDMGQPVKILDLARRMVHLSGLTVRDAEHPDGDIEIAFTGLRAGEKLYEELLIGENASGTEHPLIMRAVEDLVPWAELKPVLRGLEEACTQLDSQRALEVLESTVPIVRPADSQPDAAAPTGNRMSPLTLVR